MSQRERRVAVLRAGFGPNGFLLTRRRWNGRTDAVAHALCHCAHAGTLLRLDLPWVVVGAHIIPLLSGPTF
jgi:ABC-type Mn2+/Zn2+ transport system permease subunit